MWNSTHTGLHPLKKCIKSFFMHKTSLFSYNLPFFIWYIPLVNIIGIKPTLGDHESKFKKVGAIMSLYWILCDQKCVLRFFWKKDQIVLVHSTTLFVIHISPYLINIIIKKHFGSVLLFSTLNLWHIYLRLTEKKPPYFFLYVYNSQC